MPVRRRSLSLFALGLALALPVSAAPPARAAADCRPVPGIGAEIANFLDQVAAAQAAGRGEVPLMDVLFGVTGIDAEDRQALDRRAPVAIDPRDAGGGVYANAGPEEITVEGVFAGKETFFRLPREVRGRYTLGPDGGVTLVYDPAHAVELGERHVGMRFFAAIHHSVITPDGLAFFLDDNAGPDPDRCYAAAPG